MCRHGKHTAPVLRPLDRRRAVILGGAILGFGLLPPSAGRARDGAPPVPLPAPGPRDTCPVCGMFVARYPEWIATVLFADSQADHFDGAKDLFKYLNDMPRYARGRTADGIVAMGVTDYYTLRRIDAARAFYVIGSDVLGPMGHELVPHADRADAEAFLSDHAGRRAVSFDAVTPDLLRALDDGRFEG